jgi:hypothetical protein
MGVRVLPGVPGLPRMRGDRPFLEALASKLNQFTPHARGSTLSSKLLRTHPGVYPACAGIDPARVPRAVRGTGLPRMRGDRPGAGALFLGPL